MSPNPVDDEAQLRRAAFEALTKYQTQEDTHTSAAELEAMLDKESHRGLIIILVTYIEDALVERVCRELPNGEILRKTMKNGPLRAFEHRIKLARARGVITSPIAEILDIFRHMRNACAHCRRDISFATRELRQTLALMLFGPAREIILENPEHGPGCFITCASRMLMSLEGATEDEQQSVLARVREQMKADGRPDVVQTEWLLFESLQRRRTSKRDRDPPSPPSEKGQ